MKLFNKTKQRFISKHVNYLTTKKEKIRGLLGRKTPQAVMFKTRFGIHTFFMKFPIDILILNNKNHVVALKQNLSPNRIFLWNPFYKIVIELPTGTLKKTETNIKDLVIIKQ